MSFPAQFPAPLPTGLINRIQNGGFSLCPEGTQTVADGGTAFLNFTVLTQSGTVQTSQLTTPQSGQARAARITQTQATAQRIGLCQTIANINCQDLRESIVNTFHRARLSVSGRTMFALLSFSGTADTSPVDPINDWTSTAYIPGQFFKSQFVVLNYGYLSTEAATWAEAPYIPYNVSSAMTNLVYVAWTESAIVQGATLDIGLFQVADGDQRQQFDHRPYQLEGAIAGLFPSLNINPAAQNISVLPTGNALATLSSLNVQGTTASTTTREFLVNFGLVANKGAGVLDYNKDKVTAYFGIDAVAGAGDTWALNTVSHISSGVGSQNVHGYECDINNNNQNYGATAGSGGLAEPVCFGVQVSGFSTFSCTSAFAVSMAAGSTGFWYRGFTIGPASVTQSGIENHSDMTDLIRNYGNPTYVLRSTSSTSKMQVNAEVGFGDAPVAGVILYMTRTGDALSILSGTTSASFRMSDTGAGANLKNAELDYDGGVWNVLFLNDNGSLRAAPFGIDATGANPIIRASSDNIVDLGADLLRWRNVYGYVADMTTSYQVGGQKVVGARGAAVSDASGGATVDAEARAAINALLARVRATTGHGLISG